MSQVVSDFLDFFSLSDLYSMSEEITVSQFLGLVLCAFFAMVFTIVGIRAVIELIKIISDQSKFC